VSVFKPVRTKTASSEVAEQIKNMIIQGQLHPGDRLPSEREFAEILKCKQDNDSRSFAFT